MAWSVFGNEWESGELANTAKFQPMIFNDNIILRAIRTWIIFIDDPILTDLNCKIYSNEVISGDDTPVKLLHTSTDIRTKTEMITLENGVKEIYFTFDFVPMQQNTTYNFVINGTGYTPTSSSFVAWMKGFPDPVYTGGYTPTLESINSSPYQVYAIGSKY